MKTKSTFKSTWTNIVWCLRHFHSFYLHVNVKVKSNFVKGRIRILLEHLQSNTLASTTSGFYICCRILSPDAPSKCACAVHIVHKLSKSKQPTTVKSKVGLITQMTSEIRKREIKLYFPGSKAGNKALFPAFSFIHLFPQIWSLFPDVISLEPW